ncbi:hypothetical protein [Micromonospora haikouensis]|nr:hypothetical protein [Micromonospora haikouensis]
MFTTLLAIATILAAILGAGVGHLAGARPTIPGCAPNWPTPPGN